MMLIYSYANQAKFYFRIHQRYFRLAMVVMVENRLSPKEKNWKKKMFSTTKICAIVMYRFLRRHSMMVVMVVKHQTYAVRVAFLWRFLIYGHQIEIQVVVLEPEYLSNTKNGMLNLYSLASHSIFKQIQIPGTLAMGISPRNKALILFSI